MAIRVDSPQALLAWLATQRGRYVVLREGRHDGATTELNLLADAALADALRARYPHRRRGVKIDIYGHDQPDYHGFAHLPHALAERCLARAGRDGGVCRAHPEDELAALLYHAAYHKPVQSGLPFAPAGAASGAGAVPPDGPGIARPDARKAPWSLAIARAAGAAGMEIPGDLPGIHAWLHARGYGITRDRLLAYVRHDVRYGRKSLFHGWLVDQAPGELNLFVIRAVAVRHRLADALLAKLEEHYAIWCVKPLALTTRLREARHMRGGKWRRGGRPHLAVVVFDPEPIATTVAERAVHPHVFNARQFEKQRWRAWFTDASGARPSDNPIHSTDNEAEAIGHLPLFFDAAEQAAILARLDDLRAHWPAVQPTLADVS